MTEINNNSSVHFNGNYGHSGRSAKKNEVSPKTDEKREINFDDLDKTPGAVNGRTLVVKHNKNSEECEECVRESVKTFMDNPHVCEFAMFVCDGFVKNGDSLEVAMDKTADVIYSLREALIS